MIWSVVLTAFVLVAPIELPDKTMFSTLVLATRFRPLPVLLGVIAGFGAHVVIAVAAGSLLAAHYNAPFSVFVGTIAALATIAALTVFVGSKLVTRLPLKLVRRVAAVMFAGLPSTRRTSR